jgi:signal transduction histidine kinase
MALVYYLKYQTVIVYQLDKVTQELSREHIFFLILPTLLVSFIMNAIIAIGVGMYSSRKYAVPIYKIEQWVSHLAAGKMNALLRFREKEEMKDLSDKCNNLGTTIRDKFLEIKKQTEILAQLKPESQQVNEILSILSTMEIDAMPYEISTNSYTMTKGTRVD